MLTLPDALPEWQERANCQYTDPEVFWPPKGGSALPAKRICARCEVRDECLQYALDNDERYGVWGGKTDRQRRRIQRKRAAARAADGVS